MNSQYLASISNNKKKEREISNINILNVNLFDVYEKDLSSSKQKSLAFEVILQPIEKTLKDSEIAEISNLIIERVKKDTGAILRD